MGFPSLHVCAALEGNVDGKKQRGWWWTQRRGLKAEEGSKLVSVVGWWRCLEKVDSAGKAHPRRAEMVVVYKESRLGTSKKQICAAQSSR